MYQPIANQHLADTRPEGESVSLEHELGLPLEILAPVLEGAAARGMADAFEMMGHAAVFFDAAGNVLHAGATVRKFLGQGLVLSGRQLVASTPEGNQVLQAILSAALAGETTMGELRLGPDHTQSILRIEGRAGPLPRRNGQLLNAILLFSCSTAA